MLTEYKDKFGKTSLKVSVGNIDGSINNIFIASKYDVDKEAKEFAENHVNKLKDINIMYGIGLGYHVYEISKLLEGNQKLFVFDLRTDVYEFGQSKNMYSGILKNPNVSIYVTDNYLNLSNKITALLNKDAYFFSHT